MSLWKLVANLRLYTHLGKLPRYHSQMKEKKSSDNKAKRATPSVYLRDSPCIERALKCALSQEARRSRQAHLHVSKSARFETRLERVKGVAICVLSRRTDERPASDVHEGGNNLVLRIFIPILRSGREGV